MDTLTTEEYITKYKLDPDGDLPSKTIVNKFSEKKTMIKFADGVVVTLNSGNHKYRNITKIEVSFGPTITQYWDGCTVTEIGDETINSVPPDDGNPHNHKTFGY